MPDALLFEHFLEAGLTSPGNKLPAVVRQDLTRRAPLTDRSFDHLQHGVCCLATKQSPAHDVAAVVVDDPHQVDPVHPLEFKREDVDLPEGVGQ